MDFNTSNLAWNRSFSAPDISNTGPLFRRVIIEEQYFPHNHGTNVSYHTSVLSGPPTRHFSCDQLSTLTDKSSNSSFIKPPIVAPSIQTSTPVRNEKILEIMAPDSPMDVDLLDVTESDIIIKTEKDPDSTPPKESKEPTILDFVDLTFQGMTPVLTKKLPKSEKLSKKSSKKKELHKTKKGFSLFKSLVAVVIPALLGVAYFHVNSYNYHIELGNFQNELESSLVGQSEAISKLTEAMPSFKSALSMPEKHLLTLLGTTGVGKTHCVNVIKRKFMPKQIVEIDIDTLDISTYKDSLNSYTNAPHLVIFDDLKYKHIPKLTELLKVIPENRRVLVVAVFNVQETDDFKSFTINNQLYDIIPVELQPTDFVSHTIKFESFGTDFAQIHLDEFSQVYSEKIKTITNWKSLLESHDFRTFGFKGLFEKMNILSK
ncbi:uncharacterized protein [Atheta coriaria]|uniref:uncharacterized protein isoform X1 n=1 Tax=Dalotia coriaria TaxID=877792 RepID=UPI0031F33757